MTEPPLGPFDPTDPNHGEYQAPLPAAPQPAKPRLVDRLGSRVLRRPEPRFGVALAGIGVLLMIGGILVWGGDYASSGGGGAGGGGSESHKWLGVALALAAVVAGYTIALVRRGGPAVNAGVAASALGVPVLLAFLSFSPDGFGEPFSIDAIAIVSMLVWLASYLLVPVVRGHVFYLGATAVTLWLYVLDKIDANFFLLLFLPREIGFSSADAGPTEFSVPGFPDPNNIAAVSLVFGLAFYLTAVVLDRAGKSGAGTAFVVAGLPATVVGLIAASINMPQSGIGVLIIVIGPVIAMTAGRGRRLTMWTWTFAIGVGIVVILADVIPDNTTGAGISLIVLGLIVVALAAALATGLNEPDETTSTPA